MDAARHWKKIPGFPYLVSSDGLVWSLLSRKYMTFGLDKDGYKRLTLYRDGKHRLHVHVLVCLAFNGPKPFPKAQVRHLDGTVDNNDCRNLAWGTSLDNHDDRRFHGNDRYGEKNISVRLKPWQVRYIRSCLLPEGMSRKTFAHMLSKRFKVSTDAIRRVADYESWPFIV